MGSGGQNDTLTANQLARIDEKEDIFMNSTYIMCRKQESNVFWALEAESESNSNQIARIREKKIFHDHSTYIMSRKRK